MIPRTFPRLRRLIAHPGLLALSPERLTLALLALAAAGLWAFVELADEVFEGATAEIDTWLILALRDAADIANPAGPAWLQEMMRDFTGLGGTGALTLVTFAAAGFLVVARRPRAALAVLVAVGGAILVSTLLKAGFDRPRPDLVPHGSYVATASFPSGHSLMTASVTLTLGAMLARVLPTKRLRIYVIALCILVTLLVGASRVYLGVHWPSDVLAGWLVGGTWALICSAVMLRLQVLGVTERRPCLAESPDDGTTPTRASGA